MESTPRLTFEKDGTLAQSAPLVAGAEVVVQYHRARLAGQAALDQGGEHDWVISGFCKLEGGPTQVFHVGGRSSDELAVQALALPAAGVLEIWFERSDLYGQQHFDSNCGQNYRFTVLPSPVKAPEPRATESVQVLQRLASDRR